MITRRGFLLGLGAVSFAVLAGCDDPAATVRDFRPVPIAVTDECALCGMTISRFPGPKGEAFFQGREEPLKFCSTRDLLAYLNQPESRTTLAAAFVHDLGQTTWQDPADSTFTDAQRAWYVVGHPLKGAMGPSPASFAERAAAEAFAAERGGRVLAFKEVDQQALMGEHDPQVRA